jgi:hypothetical protein
VPNFKNQLKDIWLFCSSILNGAKINFFEIIISVKLGYNEFGYKRTLGFNEQILSQIGHFSTQNEPGCNELSQAVRYIRV